jgi:NTP pyrophosphatase (non-canonical NTP hydrolase)
MLTNERIAAIHANAVAHGFWEPGSEPTFGEYCAFIHEEISEAFSAWRNNEPDEYVVDGKPEGVWVEMADVVIRCADAMGAWNCAFEMPNIHVDPRHYTFGAYITLLHSIISDMWNNGDERTMGCQLCVIVEVVYSFADHNGIDLDAIIDRKCEYNATRPYKHGKRM